MKNVTVLVHQDVVKQDKNQKNYKTTTFSTPEKVNIPGVGDVFVKPRITKINLYESSYLPGNPMDFGYNHSVGSKFLGSVETRDVEAYEIPRPGKAPHIATTYTCVVLGDSESPAWESLVRQTMKQRGHLVVDRQAVSLVPERKETSDATAGAV